MESRWPNAILLERPDAGLPWREPVIDDVEVGVEDRPGGDGHEEHSGMLTGRWPTRTRAGSDPARSSWRMRA